MHNSIFSYALSRPYPYRWFTWLVFLGGFVATALFTVINLAADGYELNIITTSDPNGTMADSQSRWFEKWSLSNKISVQCQAQSVNFTPTIQLWLGPCQAFKERGGDEDGDFGWNDTSKIEPSFAYLNNRLEDCEVASISINIATELEFAPGLLLGTYAEVCCNVSTGAGAKRLGLTAGITNAEFTATPRPGYDYTPDPGAQVGLSNLWQTQNQNSFIWGLGFLWEYGASIQSNSTIRTQITDAIGFCETALGSTLSPAPPVIITVYYTEFTDIMDSDFFHYVPVIQLGCPQALTGLNLTGPTFTSIDGLTKSFYSMLLTDLGQTSKTNILAHPHLLLEFQKLAYINDLLDPSPPAFIFQNQTSFFNYYNQSKLIGVAGIPSVKPAVILQQYFCQVPQLKSTGSLLIAVIVADLVFLQALWQVLNLVVTFLLERRHPEAKYCAGCAKRLQMPHEGYELVKGVDEEGSETKGTSVNVSTAVRGEKPEEGKAKGEDAQTVPSPPSAAKAPA